MNVRKGIFINECRVMDAYMRIFDHSDKHKFKFVVESNVLKKFKFTVAVTGNKISIVGELDAEATSNGCSSSSPGGAAASTVHRMCCDYELPQDVDPDKVVAIETDRRIKIEAPRTSISRNPTLVVSK